MTVGRISDCDGKLMTVWRSSGLDCVSSCLTNYEYLVDATPYSEADLDNLQVYRSFMSGISRNVSLSILMPFSILIISAPFFSKPRLKQMQFMQYISQVLSVMFSKFLGNLRIT